jgi:hypothetical protein
MGPVRANSIADWPIPLPLRPLGQRRCQRVQAVVAGQTDGVGDLPRLTVVVDGGNGKARLGAELDRDIWEVGPEEPDEAPQGRPGL